MQSSFLRINRLLLNISNTLLSVPWNCKISEVSRICLNHQWKPYSSICSPSNMSQEGVGWPLKGVLDKLLSIAPLSIAENWDNVGLLVEPSTPKLIKKVFLTNDLTERVLDEAIFTHADLIVSYHPPIFVPLRSLTTRSWKERVIVKCIENKIAVFSPHSTYDAVEGGVTDWMASAFRPDCKIAPLMPAVECSNIFTVQTSFPNSPDGNAAADNFVKKLHQYFPGSEEEINNGLRKEVSEKEVKLSLPTDSHKLHCFVEIFHSVKKSGSRDEIIRILKYEQLPIPRCGAGRMCLLKSPLTVADVVKKVKKHINLSHVRLALVPGKTEDALVSTIAICVGSGSSILKGVKADMYLTGEMLHHEILEAVHNGCHVILCNHSDSERGFLNVLAGRIHHLLKGRVEVIVSKEDKDPLNTV